MNYNVDEGLHKSLDKFVPYKKMIDRQRRIVEILDRCQDGDLSGLGFDDVILVSGFSGFTPQERTSFLEEFMCDEFGWKPVSSRLNRGDYIDANGRYFELKCSASNKNNKIHILQIRPWQKIDYYIVMYFDLDAPDKSKMYVLTHDEMLEEVSHIGKPTHGTKAANAINGNIEYSIHLPIDNKWDGKYLKPFPRSKSDFARVVQDVQPCTIDDDGDTKQ